MDLDCAFLMQPWFIVRALFYVRAAPQRMEVLGGLLHYPFEDLAGWYRVRKALVLAVRGATTT